MVEVSASLVKELREQTGAGMMECKKALVETGGSMEKALIHLREKGLASAAKRASRATSEGLVEAYIHGGGRLGVLLEVNCETDFVAKTPDFKELVRDLAMQIAASNPEYISKDDIPVEIIEREKNILRTQALNEGKPEKIVERIVTGRIDKYYQEVCLMEQQYVKDQDKTIQDLIKEKIAKIGENINVKRFVRFQLGVDSK